jgi:rRNA processing
VSSKKDHKIVLRKRLERAKKALHGASNDAIARKEERVEEHGKEYSASDKKSKPDPFAQAQQQATHYSTQRELLFERMQQERLEKERMIKEKKDKRERDRRIHLSRTKKGQPRLGGMLEGLLGRIEKQMHQ